MCNFFNFQRAFRKRRYFLPRVWWTAKWQMSPETIWSVMCPLRSNRHFTCLKSNAEEWNEIVNFQVKNVKWNQNETTTLSLKEMTSEAKLYVNIDTNKCNKFVRNSNLSEYSEHLCLRFLPVITVLVLSLRVRLIIPLTTSSLIDKNVLIITGTPCIRTFWTLTPMRSIHFSKQNMFIIAGCSNSQ